MPPEVPVDSIQSQLSRCQQLSFYQTYFTDAGIDPAAITSAEDFRALPFMNREDVIESTNGSDQFGGLHHYRTRFIGFTPSGAERFMPEYHTMADIEASAAAWAELYETAGVGEGDVVYNAYGYEYFGAAHIFQQAAQMAGATVIPAGPGDTDLAIDLIETYDINVFMGNPS